MTATIVYTRNLSRAFSMGSETVVALDGVDLDVPRGSFTAVLGPSGSGKSTLLHLLGGLDRPSAGSIEVDAQRLEALDENALAAFRRTTVGFIFQSFNLIPSMSALGNVGFPMQFAGTGPGPRQARAWELLREVGLEDRAYHRPAELSGGQQQRVAVARALVNNPQLILADEPTGNLDSLSGAQMMHLLAELHRQGRTVIVVSHDPRMLRYATHTIRLLDGRVVGEVEYEAALALAAGEKGLQ
jgi:putative ABC transport system ATP-binding protein